MIDVDAVVRGSLVQDAIDACRALQAFGRFRTPYHPNILGNLLDIATDCPERPKDFKLDIGPRQGLHLLDTICLTSGGADSTIAWYLAGKPKGMYIDIGQKYASRELYYLEQNEVNPIIVDLGEEILGDSPNWKHIIPGRNFLFLTIAAECIKDGGKIIFSIVNGEGFDSGKGDKSALFIMKWLDWYYALTGKTIKIETSESKTKAEWLSTFAIQFNVDIIRYKTVTCFSAELGKQCGQCQACLRKYLSFITAFKLDTSKDYRVHPMEGSAEFVDKYKVNLNRALQMNDYSHYSLKRCTQDLEAIKTAEMMVK